MPGMKNTFGFIEPPGHKIVQVQQILRNSKIKPVKIGYHSIRRIMGKT